MPQVFQVLKCYKCLIFQVHQTKKDNKWKCKVCDEKQSVKRHYGIGTAKDCRIHVQKLNNLRGDIEESKFKTVYSEYSDCHGNTCDDKIKNVQASSDKTLKESKWSAYVEKEEIYLPEPENIDNVVVCLEGPQKRKIKRNSKPFKVPKVCKESNDKTIIINESSMLTTVRLNTLIKDKSEIRYKDSKVKNEIIKSTKEKQLINKSEFFYTDKDSKWAQYLVDNNNEINDQFNVIDDDEKCMEHHNDGKTGNSENNYYQDERECFQPILTDDVNKSNCKETEVSRSTARNPLFSLCDDNDLDTILDL